MLNFILIDDDPLSNRICTINLRKALREIDVKAFTEPEKGLSFIEAEYSKSLQPAIIFLDLNMPGINGWEFIERYENLSKEIKSHLTIYLLSSSINTDDERKAGNNHYIKKFISKPLTIEVIQSLKLV